MDDAAKLAELRRKYGGEWEVHDGFLAATRIRMPTAEELARGVVYGLFARSLEELGEKLAAQRRLKPLNW